MNLASKWWMCKDLLKVIITLKDLCGCDMLPLNFVFGTFMLYLAQYKKSNDFVLIMIHLCTIYT